MTEVSRRLCHARARVVESLHLRYRHPTVADRGKNPRPVPNQTLTHEPARERSIVMNDKPGRARHCRRRTRR